MLAKSWVRWKDPDDPSSAEIFSCLGIARIYCDTHGEEEGWEELRMLARLIRAGTMAYGIPSGTALVANPDVSVEISGHTDNIGDDAYNQTLSLDRAQAVKNWLVQKGIASNRMKTVGKGEKEPVSSNTSSAGRAENRRIEFFVER